MRATNGKGFRWAVMIKQLLASAILASAFLASPAFAQSDEKADDKEPRRTRIGLGAQIAPSFPGSREHSLRPYFDFSRAKGDKPFDFEAPDENIGLAMVKKGGFQLGPAINIEGKRTRKKVGSNVDEVGTTVEVGGFAQYWLAPAFRIRVEARQGIGGHKSLVGSAGADYVIRDGDKWLVSLGPRVSFAEQSYQQAYFGVNAREATATGLPLYRPKGGIHALGAVAGLNYALSKSWGLMSFAKYDRLTGDAADSPLIRRYGKRDQLSGGLGLTYTFGKDMR